MFSDYMHIHFDNFQSMNFRVLNKQQVRYNYNISRGALDKQ